ncbi:luc7-like protein 3 [Bombina bombina]|uniref:luc7-like protein 3 n=1 Tax=Bombina bombina TaxID=8345 RepID=UPI00235B2147|nr:luc7-like protein 3 [Bombina bombina]
MLSAAQLLDELMGRDRNLAPDEKRCNVRWDDESVCKYYLCEFCPAELFTNTRSDLGPCEKIHDENLRKQYEKSSRYLKVGYEKDFLRYLQSLLAEVERRIRRGHARLALSQNQQASGSAGPAGKNEEKGQVLTDKIEALLLQIEELGSEGKVEEAQGMMKLVEQLKEEREQMKSTTSRTTGGDDKGPLLRVGQVHAALGTSSNVTYQLYSLQKMFSLNRSRDRQSHIKTERKPRSRSRDRRRSKSKDRKSNRHKSKSRERERERKSKEKEKRSSDDKKSRESSSREKQSESRKTETKELASPLEVNGANEGNKSEGDTQSN